MKLWNHAKALARPARLPLLLVALLLGSGCPGGLGPGECNSNADCTVPGHACVNGYCQEVAAACSGDGDCPFGERCVAGRCEVNEDLCHRDADCDPGYRCEVLSGACLPLECQRDEDCDGTDVCDDGECRPPEQTHCIFDPDCDPPETVCEDGECVPGCVFAGCPSGSGCNENTGRCDEPEHCVEDTDCDPPSFICEDQECVPGCTAGSCPLEHYCDSRSGRCVPGCTSDTHCGPPIKICEGGDCVAGCLTTGCEDGYSCDANAGRCTPEAGCLNDADCGPPSMICEDGDCVSGCLSTGCGYEEHCNTSTGRCDPGCVQDTDCSPPQTVCIEGQCETPPDCMQSGCPTGELCDPESGICEPAGTTPLGHSCEDGSGRADHTACASDYCAPLESPGPICSAACTTTSHCPTSFGCLGLNPPGAAVCLPWTQTAGPGSPCGSHEECRSGLCHEGACVEACQHDRDCSGSHICGLVLGNDYMATGCRAAAGAGSTGSSCQYLDDCRSFLCVGDRCADPCHTSSDCPTGFVCGFVSGPDGRVRACVYAGGASTGAGQVGATCDPDTDQPCRSLWCQRWNEDDTDGICLDVCATQDDCPTGYRCTVVSLGEGDEAHTAPLCLPR